MSLDGVLVVDKAAGPTSHDVVVWARRLLGTRRVGHTGTLDPFATGVLPLVVGRATRLARFFSGAWKTYLATLCLGVSTDTHDALGQSLTGAPQAGSPSLEDIEEGLARFRGVFLQVPPAFSAKRIEGVRAYELARDRKPVELQPVRVEVRRLDVESFSTNQLVVSLECSAGFYVRGLARDLGDVLGCGAHLTDLRRTRSGEFDESQSVRLERFELEADRLHEALVPLTSLVPWLPTAIVAPDGVDRVSHGNAIAEERVARWEAPRSTAAHSEGETSAFVRLAAPDGTLLGVARRASLKEPLEGAVLQPFVVLV